MPVESSGEKSLEPLKALMAEEVNAVLAYKNAVVELQDSPVYDRLLECQRSHARRAHRLREVIVETWGAESLAIKNESFHTSDHWQPTGEIMALLRHGENATLAQYRQLLDKVQGPAREIIDWEFLPQQERCAAITRDLA